MNSFNNKKCWYRLKIDTSNSINPNFDKDVFLKTSKHFNQPGAIWRFTGEDMFQILNKDWVDYLSSIGIPVTSFLLFYREPFLTYHEAHTDIFYQSESPSLYGLNFVFSPNDDSFMTWYNLENKTGILKKTTADTKYIYWPMSDVEDKELDRLTIGNKLTLVKTGIAHNVIVNSQPRWAISLRSDNLRNVCSWNEVVSYYSNLIEE